MRFSKKSIYDKKLNCVAFDVVIDAIDETAITDDDKQLFSDFITSINTEAGQNDSEFNIIIDKYHQSLINTVPEDLQEKCVFKIEENQLSESGDNNEALAVELNEPVELNTLPQNLNYLFIPLKNIAKFAAILTQLIENYKLVVTDVNEHTQLEKIQTLNVGYYCGTFIEKPQQINQSSIPANKISILNLISALNDPKAEIDKISQIITADNILSYKLLRIVNSPIFRGVNQLNSIQDAIVRFGFGNLKKWVLMLSLCSISDKPKELIKLALLRALSAATLAEKLKFETTEIYYTAGLLSTLDAFLDFPLEQLLKDTALDEEVKAGILNREGKIGEILNKVIDYQHGKKEADSTETDDEMTQVYIESNEKAAEIFSVLGMD